MRVLPAVALLFILCCSPDGGEPARNTTSDADPYAERVAAAHERLEADSAGRLVLRAIHAHGGLEAWYGNGILSYLFRYRPLDDGSPRVTEAYNDYRSSRAVHFPPADTTQAFGFDGEQAWSMTGGAVRDMNPRFWSLTPYYFVGLPFVLADEGIHFTQLPDRELNGRMYHLVRVSFGEGIGDAPDDYYVLYLNPNTGQLDALRYIVSYPGYFPDGGHAPEKLMVITGKTTVDGITLPTGYDTFWWNDGTPGEKITDIKVHHYAYHTDLPDTFFDRPAGARVFTEPSE